MMSDTLTKSLNEKDVENTYRHNFLKKFKDMEITSPFKCDGFGVSKTHKVRVLMEYKDDVNLSNKSELVKVLAQSIFYVKSFYNKGMVPPSTVFIADRNECLALHVNDLINYLDMDLDWKVAPSSAHTITDLVLALMNDDKIRPFIYKSNDFEDCVQKIKDLTDNVQRKVLVTDHNITEVFRYFDEKVLGKSKLTTNEKANLFVQMLVNKDDNYLHPVKRRKTVVTKAFNEIAIVSRESFESFFGHFASSYSPSQKHKLAAVVDRIVEDTTRRKQGEFFTPAIWVDKAHEYIASVYGENWKEEYVVWDPAWGTGNLTRDYSFKELYVSTLNQSDIDTANQMGYNTEAIKFKYDFLNDEYEKLPEGLRKAIEDGRQIIVLMNPPYARSNGDGKVGTVEKNSTDTKISEEMKTQNWGSSSSQLYSQFLYRLWTWNINKNVHIAIFSKSVYKTGQTFKKFRSNFYQKYQFNKGFMFNASHFSDTTNSWGVDFSIWETGNERRDSLVIDILDYSVEGYIDLGTKQLYHMDNKLSASDWVKQDLKGKKTIDKPQLTSALKIKNSSGDYITEDALGCFMNKMNSVYVNDTWVGLFSSSTSKGNGGVSIIPENFYKVTSVFTSRKCVSQNWICDKDEYFYPKTNHKVFQQFTYDSLIYSLFNNSSEQSSLRQVEYKGQMWDIKNEFFWMSKDQVKDLADENGYDNLYNDARTSNDRHVYKLLFGEERIYDKLSPDAKLVLDKATELVEKSMEIRQVMANDENHLDSWDAGYAQLKLIWKEYFQEDFKEFRQLYKNLEDRMRPLVYELGFLMK
jgi:hypothetical protein